MKIEKIIMKNYRQYRDLEITFTSDKLNLIKGIMGTGKTNFLNAINWCLYKEEPYLSRESKQLPLLNLKTIDEGNEQDIEEVMVEIWIKIEDDRPVVFTRKAQFLIIIGEKKDVTQYKTTEFEAKIMDDSGNYKIYTNEEAESYVVRFVPYEVRDFFFFDGERLDRYFKEATGQNIRNAIFQISQTNLLKKISDNLKKIKKEYDKDAGKLSPNIEFIRTQLEDAEKRKNDITRLIEECKNQIKIANDKKKEYNEKLKGLPDIEGLQQERERLKKKRKEDEDFEKEKVKDKRELLFEYGKNIYLIKAIQKAIKIINDKKSKGEIPPTGDKKLLEKIEKEKFCSICGRPFSEDSKEHESVKKLLDGINLSSEVAIDLQSIESPLNRFQDLFTNFKQEINKITVIIDKYSSDIRDIDQKLEDIDNQLGNYNEEKVKNWYNELKNFEYIYANNNKSLGMQELTLKKVTDEYEQLKPRLDDELARVEKIGKIKRYIDFLNIAIDIVDVTKENVMDQIRQKISSETEKKFFNLMWKKETFSKVNINEDYEISLIHSMGYECLGTISGGEREVLALSFTMALHSISGFNAPILIDRPLAMVSGSPRQNIANILLELSKEKQLILFLTPDDYKDVSQILNTNSCHIRELKMTKDEKEVITEVI